MGDSPGNPSHLPLQEVQVRGMFLLAMALSCCGTASAIGLAANVAPTTAVPGAVLAALIAALASLANTLILTRVRRVQDEVGGQVAKIKSHAEALTDSDDERAGQISMLRELSRDRSRQISELSILADRLSVIGDRLSVHMDTMKDRGEQFRDGDK